MEVSLSGGVKSVHAKVRALAHFLAFGLSTLASCLCIGYDHMAESMPCASWVSL